MPTNSMIIGVDVAPIKPVPRTITFQSDITTDKCRAKLRQHLKTWKADTVLHDGAPNVGTAWVQDAFSQAELVLQALKLATEFLIEGGTFVTKIFRSKDYNALLWVFHQLFTKVEATKPPSSRTASAEIFAVCRGFKAPKRIDPKFLDARSVFAELSDPTPDNEAKVFNPERRKRKREGYEEGDYIQFKQAPASAFIETTDPIAMLGSLSKLSFDQQGNGDIVLTALDRSLETTDEIRQCCKDLKVLGRKDFRMLFRWRLKAREIFGFTAKTETVLDGASEEVAEIESMDDELRLQEDLQGLGQKESARKKRERRRDNERKQREIIRMQMHMRTPMEIGLEQKSLNGEDAMFSLKTIEMAGAMERIAGDKMGLLVPAKGSSNHRSEFEESNELDDKLVDEVDEELDALYDRYQKRRSKSDAKYQAKRAQKDVDDDWEGFSDREKHSNEELEQHDTSEESSIGGDLDDSRQLLYPEGQVTQAQNDLTRRAASFFDREIFKNISDLCVAEENDSAAHLEGDELHNGPAARPAQVLESVAKRTRSREAMAHSQGLSSDGPSTKDTYGHGGDNSSDGQQNFEVVMPVTHEWDAQGGPQKKGWLNIDIITAEAMTLAQQVASGQKPTNHLIDDGFNKHAFRDTDGLPEWFLDDENKHSKPHRPINAAGAAAIKEKLRALNARPIKKVREAKDRKKYKAAQKLEKLRKKSALVADDEGLTEKDKAQNIVRLMSKAAKKKPRQQVKLVVARGGNRGISGRPRGVKGKYKIVDARLRKDVRAEKRLAKKKR